MWARQLNPTSIWASISFLGLALIALVWITTAFHLQNEKSSIEQAAVLNSSNLASAFEEHLSRTLNEIDRSIKSIRANYLSDPDNFDFKNWLKRNELFDNNTLQASIISPSGFIKLSSIDLSSSVGTDLRDREHFQVQAKATSDALFISKPLVGRTTGKWSVQLTRRIEKTDGSFGGMIVVSLDPAYLARFYNSVDLDRTDMSGSWDTMESSARWADGTQAPSAGTCLEPTCSRMSQSTRQGGTTREAISVIMFIDSLHFAR